MFLEAVLPQPMKLFQPYDKNCGSSVIDYVGNLWYLRYSLVLASGELDTLCTAMIEFRDHTREFLVFPLVKAIVLGSC